MSSEITSEENQKLVCEAVENYDALFAVKGIGRLVDKCRSIKDTRSDEFRELFDEIVLKALQAVDKRLKGVTTLENVKLVYADADEKLILNLKKNLKGISDYIQKRFNYKEKTLSTSDSSRGYKYNEETYKFEK